MGVRDIRLLTEEVADALAEAIKLHPDMTTTHDGYGVILEELDELWDRIKSTKATRPIDLPADARKLLREEASHVAAMAIRFMRDIG